MANPQPDQYTVVSNELLEALCFAGLKARELRVFLVIVRLTYGFNRKSHRIPLSVLSEMTGIGKGHCSEIVQQLLEDGYLVETYDARGRRLIGVGKDYETWKRCSVPVGQTYTGTTLCADVRVPPFGTRTNTGIRVPNGGTRTHGEEVPETGTTGSRTWEPKVPVRGNAIQKENLKENLDIQLPPLPPAAAAEGGTDKGTVVNDVALPETITKTWNAWRPMDWGVETERRLLAFIRDFGEERVCQELRNAQLYEEQTRRRVGNVVRFIEEALKKTKKKHGAADGRSPLDVLNRGYREDGTHWSVGETPPEAGAKPCLYDPGWWLLPDGKHGTDGRNVSIMSSKTETYPLAA